MRKTAIWLFVLMCFCSCAFSAPSSPPYMPPTGAVLRTDKLGKVKAYKSTGTAASNGTALATAAAAAVAGDTIKVGKATYNLVAPLTLAEGVLLIGDAEYTGAGAASAYAAQDGNLFRVGPGYRYTTAEAAVVAANAVDSATNPITILVSPGVSQTHATACDAYVTVLPAQQTGTSDGIFREWPQRQPYRYITPCPALLCLRCDDGDDFWFTTSATLGGVTPYQYAASRGIVFDLAINTAYLDGTLANDANKLTAAQIRQLNWAAGFGVSSHGHVHDTQPTTSALIRRELVQSASVLRTLSDNGVALGLRVPCFVQSGQWASGTAGSGVNIDLVSEMNGEIGCTLRSTYDCSMAYLGGLAANAAAGAMGLNPPYHHARVCQQTINIGTTDAQIDNLLIQAATPGQRTVICVHKICETAGEAAAYMWTAAQFKRVVDALSGPYATKISTCTLDAIFNGEMAVPATCGATVVEYQLGGIPGGYFDDVTTATLATAVDDSGYYQGCHLVLQAGDTATIESVDPYLVGMHQYSNVRFLQLLRTTTSGDLCYIIPFAARAGSHRLRFDWKKSEAVGCTEAGNLLVMIDFYKDDGTKQTIYPLDYADPYTGSATYAAAPDEWTTKQIGFSVPNWAVACRLTFDVKAVTAGNKAGVLLDNIEAVDL